jgi:hypothetical protein
VTVEELCQALVSLQQTSCSTHRKRDLPLLSTLTTVDDRGLLEPELAVQDVLRAAAPDRLSGACWEGSMAQAQKAPRAAEVPPALVASCKSRASHVSAQPKSDV